MSARGAEMRNAQTINAINTVPFATQILGTMAVICVRGAALVVGKFHHVAHVERFVSGIKSPTRFSKRCGEYRSQKRLSNRALDRQLHLMTVLSGSMQQRMDRLAAAATASLAASAAWMWPASSRGQSLSLATDS
jgi:hypothetical protein